MQGKYTTQLGAGLGMIEETDLLLESMSSLKTNFAELLLRIDQGRNLGPASFEPIYYLNFDPSPSQSQTMR